VNKLSPVMGERIGWVLRQHVVHRPKTDEEE
jgi:hypothetical protein